MYVCEACPAGKYTLDMNSYCKLCSSIDPLNCSYGGHSLFPNVGYWRLNENSTNFIKCPKDYACLGSMSAENNSIEFYKGICENGYEGALCNECAEGYGKSD